MREWQMIIARDMVESATWSAWFDDVPLSWVAA
jgi:hypothetical protein